MASVILKNGAKRFKVVCQWIFIVEGFLVKGAATHLKDPPFPRGSLKAEAFG